MYNAESTNKHTPNDSNNVESNDFDAKRLLLFEHVRDTAELRSNNTRSYIFLYIKVMTRLKEVKCFNQK